MSFEFKELPRKQKDFFKRKRGAGGGPLQKFSSRKSVCIFGIGFKFGKRKKCNNVQLQYKKNMFFS
jgi:hypothetical protein